MLSTHKHQHVRVKYSAYSVPVHSVLVCILNRETLTLLEHNEYACLRMCETSTHCVSYSCFDGTVTFCPQHFDGGIVKRATKKLFVHNIFSFK